MGYLDVGGGLGIDYDGSQTASIASTNYSLQNYANDVVATIKECCESKQIQFISLLAQALCLRELQKTNIIYLLNLLLIWVILWGVC